MTIETNCPMHLRKYPLDKQACPLVIGSCKYDVYSCTKNYILQTTMNMTCKVKCSIFITSSKYFFHLKMFGVSPLLCMDKIKFNVTQTSVRCKMVSNCHFTLPLFLYVERMWWLHFLFILQTLFRSWKVSSRNYIFVTDKLKTHVFAYICEQRV